MKTTFLTFSLLLGFLAYLQPAVHADDDSSVAVSSQKGKKQKKGKKGKNMAKELTGGTKKTLRIPRSLPF